MNIVRGLYLFKNPGGQTKAPYRNPNLCCLTITAHPFNVHGWSAIRRSDSVKRIFFKSSSRMSTAPRTRRGTEHFVLSSKMLMTTMNQRPDLVVSPFYAKLLFDVIIQISTIGKNLYTNQENSFLATFSERASRKLPRQDWHCAKNFDSETIHADDTATRCHTHKWFEVFAHYDLLRQ